MHEERYGVALVTVGEGQSQRVMAIGGSNNGGVVLSSAEIFDTTTETWSMSPDSMEQARDFMAYITINDNICG